MYLYLRTQKMYKFETDLLLSCGLPLFVLCSDTCVKNSHLLSADQSGGETGLSM